ncbi:MAG: tRNA 2-thiouridine(34) synthase MnmA [Magnetococcus sp. DMHC-6]
MNLDGIVKKNRVAVAMSGGVDSATVAAWLLERGYEVIGLTMALWQPQGMISSTRTCCASEDRYDARQVAQKLGIPFYIVNLEYPFLQEVIGDFLRNYAAGRTPNPCIECNRTVKFTHLLARAQAMGAEFLATGHYAVRKVDSSGHPQLWRGCDPSKDQSYFLFATTLRQLQFLRFPLGDRTKEETRALAKKFDLHVARKPESQDLCFIPEKDRTAFFARYAPTAFKPGEVVDLEGRRLGEHAGIGHYTIGQRRGLGISASNRQYVVEIRAEENQLVLGPEAALYRDRLTVERVNWLGATPMENPTRLSVRTRYAVEPVPATLTPLSDTTCQVVFDHTDRAITSGQACVFYAGDI